MKIASWNVNSVRARLPRLLAWLQSREPDLLCLQETKVVDDDFPRLEIESSGYRVEAFGQKTYNGVAMLSREEPLDVIRGLPGAGAEARLIAATVSGLRIINIYVPNGSEVGSEKYAQKLSWLDHLHRYLSQGYTPTSPLLLCGDFNIAPEDRDIYDPRRWRGKVLASEPEREKFRELLDWGLVDALRRLTEAGGIYTWWDYRLGAFRRDWGLRIDHFLATEPVARRVRAIHVDREERGGEKPSDHAPLVAEVDAGTWM
jgi:exodeoxyribonuclease-3